jgi:hypothetical protein
VGRLRSGVIRHTRMFCRWLSRMLYGPPYAAERRNISHSAVVAQLVERKLPKLEVAGSTPVRRFRGNPR